MLGLSLLLDIADGICLTIGSSEDREDYEESIDIINCEPIVDVFDDEERLTVVFEVPGYKEEVNYQIQDDILSLLDDEEDEFHEILLPDGYNTTNPASSVSNNGVTTLVFEKGDD
jgi:HSP20 family molecular chaperone IbpA